MIVNAKALWESEKLAAISLQAALAYPYLLGVADDWGRAEYNPRKILARAFPKRDGVTERHIRRWLEEYERVRVPGDDGGLIEVYLDHGVKYFEWRKWKGVPPSRRRFRRCPPPATARPVDPRSSGDTENPSRNPHANPSRQPEGNAEEYRRGYYDGPPSVPSVPSVTNSTLRVEPSAPEGGPSGASGQEGNAAAAAEAPPEQPPAPGEKAAPKVRPFRSPETERLNVGTRAVFAYWQTMMGTSGPLDRESARRIRARLVEGFTVADVMAAIDGCRASPWHMGDNPERRLHNDITTICRDGAQIRKLRALAEKAPKPKSGPREAGLPYEATPEGRAEARAAWEERYRRAKEASNG